MSFVKKWYTYQKVRFPILTYGLYVFCIVFATFCFCSYSKNMLLPNSQDLSQQTTEWLKIIPMYIVTFLLFLMVRIIDEFKDYEEDCKYRPYRPVPRGLIKLSELKVLFIICIIAQTLITAIFNNKIGIYSLIGVWIYFALMSKEFCLKKIVDKHILFGVLLDELLMPILILYLSTYIYTDLSALLLFLIMSYIVSWIVEVARKIRSKECEEKGVKTYTAVFGIKKATLLLWGFELIVAVLNFLILKNTYFTCISFGMISIINILFMIKQSKKMAKLAELGANVYIMIIYLSMGLLIL